MSHYSYQLLSKHRSALMGVAMLWIMSFHLSPFRTYLPIIGSVSNIGYGGVDIFLFLSGFGLFFSVSKNNFSLLKYYKKRFFRIFPEFWLFLLCTFIISMKFDFKSVFNLLCCASTIGVWVGYPYFLWFISCYVLFSFAFPFYYKHFQRYGMIVPKLYIFTGLVLTIIFGMISVNFLNYKTGIFAGTISRIPIFIIGSLFGYITKEQIDSKLSTQLTSLFLLLTPLAVVILFVSFKFYPTYLRPFSLFWIPFIIISPSLCIQLSTLLERTPKIINNILSWVGNLSLELYIVHEYVNKQISEHLVNDVDKKVIVLLVVFISFILAIALKQFNNNIIKRFET